MKSKFASIGITVFITVLAMTVVLAGNNVKEYSGQKWEYAQAYYFKEINLVYVYMGDGIELASIKESLFDLKGDASQNVVILNTFGGYGWELIETDNSFDKEENVDLIIYTFKRLIQ
ncbi:MAG: hypothetical protein ABI690_24595 [Chloroflexota bacterium]